MQGIAVTMDKPQSVDLAGVELAECGPSDLFVEISWSGISSGTERLLWEGSMPHFPGMGYPLIPGYEAVGRVVRAGENVRDREGDFVFVPGSRGYRGVHSLFGGSARHLVTPAERAVTVPVDLRETATLIALAATAHHALTISGPPDLIVGHGVLGRLLARLSIALGWDAPDVWEKDPSRCDTGAGYAVTAPEDDARSDYTAIIDASGDPGILDTAIARLAKGGAVTLAGFYKSSLAFAFPPAFMREVRIKIAAEFQPADIDAVLMLAGSGRIDLDGLITHRAEARDVADAYVTAFRDPRCLKMTLDWRNVT